MKITYVPLTPDATGAYRIIFPARQLAAHGHTIQQPPTEEIRDGNITWRSVIDLPNPVGDLWCVQTRWGREWPGYLNDLRMSGQATVVECDDNYLELPTWNPAFYSTHPYQRGDRIINRQERRAVLRKQKIQGVTLDKVTSKNNRNHGFDMMRTADAVVVSTPYLADLYSQFNKNIHVVRNHLDWDIWKAVTPQYEEERERIRIGYLGVFRYRKGDLEVIRNLIPRFLARHPEVDFVANTEAVHDFLGVPTSQRITVGEYEFYEGRGRPYSVGQRTACLDIGLVPLTPGGMAEAKSHLKGLEYNGAGIPYVASNTESYRHWTKQGQNGFIAETEEEWDGYLERLVENHDDRITMGWTGRIMAKRDAIQNTWTEWESTFESILGSTTRRYARESIRLGAVQKVSELEALLNRAAELKPKIVVEVGSARGGTFWALAQVAADDALLVSIDMPEGSPLDVRAGKDVYEGRDRERMRTFVREGQRCKLIDGNSQEEATLEKLIDTLGSEKIDVLFIDADHRYAGVKRDYELYAPLVREGGLIAFHDVIPQNDTRSGVHILWQQIAKRNPEAETIVGSDNWNLGKWGGIGLVTR